MRRRTMEVAAAAAFAAIGILAVADSLRVGITWGADGPQSGTFPFWIGCLLILSSLATLLRAALTPSRALFASAAELRSVARILLPAAAFVAAIQAIGLYVPAAALIAWFLVRLGGHGPAVALASGVVAAALIFVAFELWFLVALPKGPIEAALGY
ncbi:tripartite tricarboxylate transporter TctB family protein [Elioraea sp.]|uniref:tripartite tricarboxylate transporter TctB family protein n=1 Tax=Elioraea sp. TaxID=2185103 RepID=UPI002619D63C|nr:tripartite tricarboxylate transporter TctB family protein [Elioraea sp.]